MPNLNMGPPPETNDLGPPQLKLAPKPVDPAYSRTDMPATAASGLTPPAGSAPNVNVGPPPQAPLSPSTLVPAPTVAAPAAPVDRLALATSNFDTFAKSSDPAYQKTLRDATQQAAGQGGLGSGMLKTSLGDFASNRQLQLDTMRSDLLNKATEGSIADASTAYGQALSGAQQGLATKIGEGQLALGSRAADTAEKSVTGTLGIEGGKLDLAKQAQTTGADQSQQQIDLAKKTADINAQFQAGTLTLAQKDQALRELSNSQTNTLQQGQLSLQQKAQTAQEAQAAQQAAEQTAARLQQGSQFNASLAQSGSQFAQSLAQNATQFGLGQEQTAALAKLQDATANRSIDVSSEQGKNQLLVQLAAIIGGPTGASNPAAIAAIAKQFGIIVPTATGVGVAGTKNGSGVDLPPDTVYHV